MLTIRTAFAAVILTLLPAGCDRSGVARSPAPGQPVVASASGQATAAARRAADLPDLHAAGEDVREIAANYTHLTRVTRQPVAVDALFAAACAPATAAPTTARSIAVHGPHAQTAVMIYMNPPAADAFAARPVKRYPVGSVIIKEKKASAPRGHDGVGGMIKRPPGYDAEHGDWEYFYFQD